MEMRYCLLQGARLRIGVRNLGFEWASSSFTQVSEATKSFAMTCLTRKQETRPKSSATSHMGSFPNWGPFLGNKQTYFKDPELWEL